MLGGESLWMQGHRVGERGESDRKGMAQRDRIDFAMLGRVGRWWRRRGLGGTDA